MSKKVFKARKTSGDRGGLTKEVLAAQTKKLLIG